MMRGPTGIHRYGEDGPGSFKELSKRLTAKRVGLIAGGTGITPMLQIANTALHDPLDNTPMVLLAFNSTPDDVMLYKRLNSLAAESNGQLDLHWRCSRERPKQPSEDGPVPYPWPHPFCRVSAEVLQPLLPAADSDTIICLCGPPAFNKAAKEALAGLGYDQVLQW